METLELIKISLHFYACFHHRHRTIIKRSEKQEKEEKINKNSQVPPNIGWWRNRKKEEKDFSHTLFN
jgi:hypothetical protein